MECPKCKLINPDEAQRCDCGYDFATGEMKESYLDPGERRLTAKHGAGAGALVSFVMALRVFNIVRSSVHIGWIAVLVGILVLGIYLAYYATRKASE